MPIDSSIYSNVQAQPINIPDPTAYAEKSMKLSQLGIQQAQLAQQVGQQAAVRTAYAKNTDPDSGQLDRGGFLSDLGKTAPMVASDYQNKFVEQDKQAAEAKTAQMQATHGVLSISVPAFKYLLDQPDDKAAKAYPGIISQLAAQGVPTANSPAEWNRDKIQQFYDSTSKTKENLDNQMIASNIATAPITRNADMYGSRSPNAELTSQYDKQAQPVRNSQIAMQQMLDNYHNPSPQGIASLKLNAFKIKFPTAPDVNSLDELDKAQGTTDQMRAWVNHHAGTPDQTTIDNMMRDGISTFRANTESLRGIGKRYQARQQIQNVNDPSLTYEPAVDKTYADSMDLQKKLGPYVPPAQRPGIMGALNNVASKVLGLGGNQPTQAGSAPPAPKGFVNIMAPKTGKIHTIPLSEKGEAIAAGGSVVN